MKRQRIKLDFDHAKLSELGYTYAVIEGGYVSKDIATIVCITRSPYQREVMQYRANAEVEHMENVEQLRKIGALEE